MAYDVEKIRADFPILQRTIHDKKLVYLDNGATSQKPQQVLDCQQNFYQQHNANVHRGVHTLGSEATQLYEDARKTVAEFLHASSEREIVFTRGTTEALNLIAYGWLRPHLQEGDTVAVTRLEHHSNFVPWQAIARQAKADFFIIECDDQGFLQEASLAEALKRKPKLVAMTALSNSIGVSLPIKSLAERFKAVGAKVVVDAAQAAGHMQMDVQALGIDALAMSGHKMCAPTGIGALWGKSEFLEEMQPFNFGGEMIMDVQDQVTTYNEIPYRFEAGTPNIGGSIVFAEALKYLQGVGLENIYAYEKELAAYSADKVRSIDGVRILGPRENKDRSGILSFVIDGVHPHDVSTFLDLEGIAIRAGHHCTQPLLRYFGLSSTSRASFYLYNTKAEADLLADALQGMISYFRRKGIAK